MKNWSRNLTNITSTQTRDMHNIYMSKKTSSTNRFHQSQSHKWSILSDFIHFSFHLTYPISFPFSIPSHRHLYIHLSFVPSSCQSFVKQQHSFMLCEEWRAKKKKNDEREKFNIIYDGIIGFILTFADNINCMYILK